MYAVLTQHGEPEFCDIWVRPFSVEIDGVLHGLFYEQSEDDPDSEWVMLEPARHHVSSTLVERRVLDVENCAKVRWLGF